MSLLWIFAALSVGVKFNLRNAGLSIRSRLRVPDSRLQLDGPEFLHHNAAPSTDSLPDFPQTAVACSSKLITEMRAAGTVYSCPTNVNTIPEGVLRTCRNGLLTRASRAQQFIDLVH